MSYLKDQATRSPIRREGLSYEELKYIRSTIELIEHQLNELKSFLVPKCRKHLFVVIIYRIKYTFFAITLIELFFLFLSSEII